MSITLERLKTLQRQATLATKPARPAPQHQQGVGDSGAIERGRASPSLFERGASQRTIHSPPDARTLDAASGSPGFRSPSPSSDPRASLRRLLDIRAQLPDLPPTRGPIDRALPGAEIAPGLRLIQAHVPCPVPATHLSLAFARREGAVDPRRLLFFDTETTGLAGGTGTRAFMIGAADWSLHPLHGDGLRIRQLLITTLAAEPAMLRAFADWLGPDTVLSSYNGRCYDAPLLKTRFRLARLGDPLTALDHVDLLFPTRRRYRGTWENCRLATIERELLKIVREDDLPGSEAPAAWLGFLRGGCARNLRRVAAHNHQDVVTLARLITRLVAANAEELAAPTS